MKRVGLVAAVAALVALSTVGGEPAHAQLAADSQDALRRQVERRFEVLAIQNGLVLRPKSDVRGVRLIQIADNAIAIDGTAVTGGELRDRLGPEVAELVIRVSYLDSEGRRRLVGATTAPPTPERLIEPPVPPAPPVPPLPPERPFERARRSRRDGGDRVRFGGRVTVNEGEVVTGDAVAIGGSVRIDGQVTGDAVAIGGRLELGPHADVLGDAVAIGGGMTRDPGSQVGGKVVDVGAGQFDFGDFGGRRPRFGRFLPFGLPFFGAATRMFALLSTVARICVLCVLASLVLLVGREYVERVGDRAVAEPLKAGAVGLLAQILFIPLLVITILVLVVTIVGIPFLVLIPFAMLALAVIAFIGFTAVAYSVGRVVGQRFAWSEGNPYLTAVVGILLLISPVLIARLLGLADWLLFPITGALIFLGFLVEYLAWTVGFGAVALLRFTTPRMASPQAPPPATA